MKRKRMGASIDEEEEGGKEKEISFDSAAREERVREREECMRE